MLFNKMNIKILERFALLLIFFSIIDEVSWDDRGTIMLYSRRPIIIRGGRLAYSKASPTSINIPTLHFVLIYPQFYL